VRSSTIKYPSHKETPKPKKGWVGRHPLASGLMATAVMSAGLWGAALFLTENENVGKENLPRKKMSVQKESRNKRDARIREQVNKLRHIVEFQKQLIESGWYVQRELEEHVAKEEMREFEREFILEMEGKSKDELVGLLVAQNRIIEQLRGSSCREYDQELVHEENKKHIVQQKLDGIEIVERGLLEQTIEELETLLLELEEIITLEEHYPVERYIEAMEDRALIAKAIEEKRFWNGVVPPA